MYRFLLEIRKIIFTKAALLRAERRDGVPCEQDTEKSLIGRPPAWMLDQDTFRLSPKLGVYCQTVSFQTKRQTSMKNGSTERTSNEGLRSHLP